MLCHHSARKQQTKKTLNTWVYIEGKIERNNMLIELSDT